MEIKKTIGAVSSELLAKTPDSVDPIEIERELHTEYEAEVMKCVERGKQKYLQDFFVEVITKQEPLMPNVFRNYFIDLASCPTPNYDQTVYHYVHKDDALNFIWVIPARGVSFMLKENALQIAPEEKDLLRFVLDFSDGTLYRLARKLNGEEELPAAY
jgi:hypothetical protein